MRQALVITVMNYINLPTSAVNLFYSCIPMTDPWCWYINANIDWGYIDGIHGAPYIAAPYIAAPWILWDKLPFPKCEAPQL